MAKLYFRYGAMGSAKTLNLLAVAHNYRQQDKKVLLIKPKLDSRFVEGEICSRAGLKTKADYLVSDKTCFFLRGKPICDRELPENFETIDLEKYADVSCILVDEAQFLSEGFIEDLHAITIKLKIPVIAYGLKINFKGYLFAGSKRLMELGDALEEIKTTCFYCENKATHNLRLIDQQPTFTGEEIKLGADEQYRAACKSCFYQFKWGATTCFKSASLEEELEEIIK